MAAAPGSDHEERAAPGGRMRLRSAFANLALICFGVAAAFILAEIGVRLLGLVTPNFYMYDHYRGWAPRPGASGWQRQEGNAFVAFNRDGFRGPDYPYQKPADVLRIAVLGDSFAEAQQVSYDDTFCAVAQRALTARLPLKMTDSSGAVHTYRKVEVLDFGCDGYGTAQELITLRREVWKYSPDVIVLAIFTGNDIRNNSVVLEGDKCRPFYVYRDGKLVPGGPFEDSFRFRIGCMMRFESRHSQLLNRLGDARSLIHHLIRATLTKVARPTGAELGLNFVIYRKPTTPVWVDAWRVTDAEIEMMNQDVKRHHAIFFVLTLANGIQDDPDPVKRAGLMKWLGVDSLSYPDDRIRELGERDGFAVLNLAPSMQAYAQAHHAYMHGFANTRPGEGHWNVEGHRVAGELIAAGVWRMLAREGAAPPPRAKVAAGSAAAIATAVRARQADAVAPPPARRSQPLT